MRAHDGLYATRRPLLYSANGWRAAAPTSSMFAGAAVASVHCGSAGGCGGSIFCPEKDFLKRVESCLGVVLTALSYIS